MTYDTLAAEARIMGPTSSRWRRASRARASPRRGSLAVWDRIASALGVPFSELMRTLD
ncbi:MAG: hypothetical protein JWM49_2118 [Microbacteriaceae bacterium]|nr:hypothetical protein [Microbacteriaceae bacterium]